MAGRSAKDSSVNIEIGKKLRAFRQSQNWTQKFAASVIGKSEARYGEWERGLRFIDPILVRKLIRESALPYTEKDRIFLCIYSLSDDNPFPGVEMVCFGAPPNLDEVPSLARRIYQDTKVVSPTVEAIDDPVIIRTWRERIFRFPKNKKIWITTSVQIDNQGRKNIPPGDRTTAERIQGHLQNIGIESSYGYCDNSKGPKDAKGDIVLACGPAQNTLSEQVNKVLMRENGWFKGFYFYLLGQKGKKTPPGDWTIRCHLLSEEEGIEFPGYPYADHSLKDGRMQDFGLLYIGPNPLEVDNWLVMVAGLGPIGTPGSSLAFAQPRMLEFLAKNLRGNRYYCSALVHYHFASEQEDEAENGDITSIAVIGGEVPS